MAAKRKRIPQPSALPEINPEIQQARVELGNKLQKSLIKWFLKQRKIHQSWDDVAFAGLAGAVVMQYSCLIAVDLQVPKEKFMALTGQIFDHVYDKAPKFG